MRLDPCEPFDDLAELIATDARGYSPWAPPLNEPERFVEVLDARGWPRVVDTFAPDPFEHHVVIGAGVAVCLDCHRWRFEGTPESLRRLGEKHGYVTEVPA